MPTNEAIEGAKIFRKRERKWPISLAVCSSFIFTFFIQLQWIPANFYNLLVDLSRDSIFVFKNREMRFWNLHYDFMYECIIIKKKTRKYQFVVKVVLHLSLISWKINCSSLNTCNQDEQFVWWVAYFIKYLSSKVSLLTEPYCIL